MHGAWTAKVCYTSKNQIQAITDQVNSGNNGFPGLTMKQYKNIGYSLCS